MPPTLLRRGLKNYFGEGTHLAAHVRVRLDISTREMEAHHRSVVLELEPELGRVNVTSSWHFADGTTRAVKSTSTRPAWDEDTLTELAAWRARQFLMTVLFNAALDASEDGGGGPPRGADVADTSGWRCRGAVKLDSVAR